MSVTHGDLNVWNERGRTRLLRVKGRRAADPGVPGAANRSVVARWLVRAVVVFGIVLNDVFGALSLVAPGSFLSSVGRGGEPVTDAVRVFAAYAGARELAIAAVLAVLLIKGSTRVLAGVVALVSLANALDGVDALANHRWSEAPAALIVASIFLAAALWLSKEPNREITA